MTTSEPTELHRRRRWRTFVHREAELRICCEAFEAVTLEIIRQRAILDAYIARDPGFQTSLTPVELQTDAPLSARRMAAAANRVGTGPMAAVAGTMAQLAVEEAIRCGVTEAIVENGGDIYIHSTEPVTIGLFSGGGKTVNQLAFDIEPGELPLAVCSSSGLMGHSQSFGRCDLATVVAKTGALADAAATQAANYVKTPDDIEPALHKIVAIQGVDGVLIVKEGKIGLAGKLPRLIKTG
jgi:uncharacterized protein